MNRRVLMATFAAGGLLSRFPDFPNLFHYSVSRSFTASMDGSGFVRIDVEILKLATEDGAERERRRRLRIPSEKLRGEFYVVHEEGIPLPDDLAGLPGTMIRYDTVAGAAAVRATTVIGAFRQAEVIWVVVAGDNNPDIAIDFARHIAVRVAEANASAINHEDDLLPMLPTTTDFDYDVRVKERSG